MTHPAETPHDYDPSFDNNGIPSVTAYEIQAIIDDPDVGTGLRASITALVDEKRLSLSIEQIRDMLIGNMRPGEFIQKLHELRAKKMEETQRNVETVRVFGSSVLNSLNPRRLFKK